MAPLIEITNEVLRTLNPEVYTRRENLEGIIFAYKNDGKPILNLIPLESNIFVNPLTKKEYNKLMRVYELGGWLFGGESLPTEKNFWSNLKRKFCVNAGTGDFNRKGLIQYSTKESCLNEVSNSIISTQEFYKTQKITPKMLKEINKYFEREKGK